MQDSIKIKNLQTSTDHFRHIIKGTASFEDTGPGGTVHQVRYLYWVEWARICYYRDIGMSINSNSFPGDFFHVIVHNTYDFFGSLGFMDDYEILSRAKFIRNSSVGMEHFVRKTGGQIIMREFVVLVFLDHLTNKPHPVPAEFRNAVIYYEGNNVELL